MSNKKQWKQKEWADFGRSIYDSAQQLFADKPIKEAIIPFCDDEGFLCRVIVKDIPVYVERNGDTLVHYHKRSDGKLVRTK